MASELFQLLDIGNREAVADVLSRMAILQTGESIERMGIAGPGNMNLVLRVTTSQRTLIVKQSRPWVEKYPAIEAPEDRIFAEIEFYQLVSSIPDVAARMPGFLGHDGEMHLMVMEDLGASADYGHVYASQEHQDLPIVSACEWLASLHLEARDVLRQKRTGVQIGSESLRRLNHEHMFVIPFQVGGSLDLDSITPGLARLRNHICDESALITKIRNLGQVYLKPDTSDGHAAKSSLLHGDYYPGSWLHTSDGLRVIDAEFCFIGPVEFDLAILKAHIVLSGGDLNDVRSVDRVYRQALAGNTSLDSASVDSVDSNLVHGFMGVEVLRRLLGVAQLSVPDDLALKTRMIETAVELIRGASV